MPEIPEDIARVQERREFQERLQTALSWEKVLDWSTEHPMNAIAGYAGESTACPIAIYLEEKVFPGLDVYVHDGDSISVGQHDDLEGPDWIKGLILELDDRYDEITFEDLDQTMESVNG